MKKTCETCKWRSDDFTSVCVNGNSDRRADFVSGDETCERWEKRMTEGERRLKTDRYRLEPYYPRVVERENEPSVHYLLSTPMPLDREQMELILRVVSQLRRPEEWCTDGVMLETRPRFK